MKISFFIFFVWDVGDIKEIFIELIVVVFCFNGLKKIGILRRNINSLECLM